MYNYIHPVVCSDLCKTKVVNIGEIYALMSYNIFKSKTFWTIAFMFVFNGFQAITGLLNPSVVVIGNGILSLIATIFHLQTGLSTTSQN